MEPQPSDPLKSPDKRQPSDHFTVITPKKLPISPRINQHHRHSIKLPEKYDVLLKLFDALEASMKLLRLRKSIPVFSKIRVMVENLSDRRFTQQHLAQLKFLLPEEIGVRKILFPDEETRCMKYDLQLTLHINLVASSKKRKRGRRYSCLRNCLISRLHQFVRAHAEGTEIPEEELPEPFNNTKEAQILNITKQSSSYMSVQKYSNVGSETVSAQASHFSQSFKKQFSKGHLGVEVETSLSSRNSSFQSLTDSYQTVRLMRPAVNLKQNFSANGDNSLAQVAEMQLTPIKSDGNVARPGTPALRTPTICKFRPDSKIVTSAHKFVNRPSCAKSLQFDGPGRTSNIELQLDEDECSNILDILPENLLQSIKEKEKKKTEHAKKRHLIVRLPKMFDRIQLLFQSPKFSAIRKEVLVRDLTECHSDITDEGEIEEQLKLLQEIIPEWIVHKFSPSGNLLFSINKTLDPDTLRVRLSNAI